MPMGEDHNDNGLIPPHLGNNGEGGEPPRRAHQNPEQENNEQRFLRRVREDRRFREYQDIPNNIRREGEELGLAAIDVVAVYNYTAKRIAREVNLQCWTNTLTKDNEIFARFLEQALDKLPQTEHKILYRYTGTPNNLEAFLEKYQVGREVTEPAFLSASWDELTNSDRVKNLIVLIKTRTGKNISKLSRYRKEREILTNRNKNFLVKELTKENEIHILILEEQ